MSSGLSDNAATSAKGSFTLLVGNTVAFIVNAVGAILIARMLTPSEYGLFTITLILPSFFTLFTSFGTTQALTRFIARYKSEDNSENIIGIIRAGYIFNFLTGSLLSISLYALSDDLATIILKRPEIGSYLRIASLLVLSQAMYVMGVSIFTGHEKMTLRASINIIQSVVKGIVSPLLVIFGYGVTGVVVGHTVSIAIAAIYGLLLTININRKNQDKQIPFNIIHSLNLMIGFGFPIFIGNIVVGIATQFRGFLLSWFVSDEVIGNFSIASWFNIFIGVITMSIGVTFLPAFSKFDVNRAPEKSREIFQGSIRYTSLFLIPLITFLMVSSKPVIYTIFGGMYSVRGYRESRIVADGGILASVQYEYDLVKRGEVGEVKKAEERKPWLKKLAPLVFFDYGRAKIKDHVAGEKGVEELSSVGLGMIIEIGEHFNGAVYYGFPLR